MIRINLLSTGPKGRQAKPQYDVRAQVLLGVGWVDVQVIKPNIFFGGSFRKDAIGWVAPQGILTFAFLIEGLVILERNSR